MGKNPPANARDVGSIPGRSGRSPGKGNGSPLQYSCLGSSMDREAWWAREDHVKTQGEAKDRGLEKTSTADALILDIPLQNCEKKHFLQCIFFK